jgi:hypothetical protein
MSNFQDDDYYDDDGTMTWLVESGGIQITILLLQLHDFSRVDEVGYLGFIKNLFEID